jgi:predicted O-methyltransferase YrrM
MDLFDHDDELGRILAESKLWATEEILFPTLTALLGFRLDANPCSHEFVRYRVDYSSSQLATALRRDDVYWMHPVPRRYTDTLRHQVRERFAHYKPPRVPMAPAIADASVFLPLSVISQMKAIEGWLEEDEADLLIGAVHASCRNGRPLGAIVEIGSYCGRSTIVLASAARAFGSTQPVVAIDPHLGQVGAADQRVSQVAPSREKFVRNIAAANVTDMVELVEQHSTQVAWSRPIGLLFIDGLHDYINVSRDFAHFQPWIASRGYVAFHDYAHYYPGVVAFVDELLAGGRYEMVRLVRSMMLVRRVD